MPSEPRILPPSLVEAVERYVESELDDAARFDNRHPFDESGVWSLHALAAEVYAAGWADGEAAEASRDRGARARARRPKENADDGR